MFFRLWFLQVLSGEDYVSQARDNRVRKVRIEAPRGNIVDRHGTVLVKTRVAPVVQIVPSSLPESRARPGRRVPQGCAARPSRRGWRPPTSCARSSATSASAAAARRASSGASAAGSPARPARPRRSPVPPVPAGEIELRRLYRRLGRVIDVRPKAIHERVIEGVAELPYSNVTIRTAVDRDAFNFIRERKEEFPGVAVEKQYLRDYPHDELAAQLFGTTREISPDELKRERYRGVEPGTRIGADGIEEGYDKYLRGTDGFTRVVINALGSRDDRRRMTRREPRQGKRLRLTLDLNLQRAANDALARAVSAPRRRTAPRPAPSWPWTRATARSSRSAPTRASTPTSSPSRSRRRATTSSPAEELGAPLFNRAIAATYPTGSTFKPITAMAALEEGVITPDEHDRRRRRVRARRPRAPQRQGRLLRGAQLPGALTVSSDIFFYQLGLDMNGRGPVLQEWAKRLGRRAPHGDRHPGRVRRPGAGRRLAQPGLQGVPALRQEGEGTPGTTEALFECGGIERTWSAGDNVNLAVGQGDLQATPLQLATAYSTIITGGRVPRPHLGSASRTATA